MGLIYEAQVATGSYDKPRQLVHKQSDDWHAVSAVGSAIGGKRKAWDKCNVDVRGQGLRTLSDRKVRDTRRKERPSRKTGQASDYL